MAVEAADLDAMAEMLPPNYHRVIFILLLVGLHCQFFDPLSAVRAIMVIAPAMFGPSAGQARLA